MIRDLSCQPETGRSDRAEMDSHADTCCAGSNSRLIDGTDDFVNVNLFSEALAVMKHVEIVKAGTAWDDLEGEIFGR